VESASLLIHSRQQGGGDLRNGKAQQSWLRWVHETKGLTAEKNRSRTAKKNDGQLGIGGGAARCLRNLCVQGGKEIVGEGEKSYNNHANGQRKKPGGNQDTGGGGGTGIGLIEFAREKRNQQKRVF